MEEAIKEREGDVTGRRQIITQAVRETKRKIEMLERRLE
jgi:hypothetical protein